MYAIGEAENNENVRSKYNDQIILIAEVNLKSLSTKTHSNNRLLTLFKYYLAASYNNNGLIYKLQGNLPKALEYYGKGLNLFESEKDNKGIASSLNNLATLCKEQGDILKALEYYFKSLELLEKNTDKKLLAYTLNNIGVLYCSKGDPAVKSSKEEALKAGITKGLEYFNKSLKIREEIDDKEGVASCLNNIGFIYQKVGDPSVKSSREDAIRAGISIATEYYNKSLKIREEIGDKNGIAISLNNIGIIYRKQKNYNKALVFFTKSMKTSRELGHPENIRNTAFQLIQIYKAIDNYKLALENYELYIQMRDSINNEGTRKASIKQQLKHEYETKATADSVAHAKEYEIKNAELAKQKAEIKTKKNQQYALFGGLFCVCVFGAFMYNRFKVTQKQKSIIEEQKEVVEEQKKMVEEKQKEILDSIHYARRIQMAQIPSESRVKALLNKFKMNQKS